MPNSYGRTLNVSKRQGIGRGGVSGWSLSGDSLVHCSYKHLQWKIEEGTYLIVEAHKIMSSML